MSLLPPVSLTPSLLPDLLPQEIQVATLLEIELRLYTRSYSSSSSTSPRSQKLEELCQRSDPVLTLTLTTHRLIFSDETTKPVTVVYVPLSAVLLKQVLTNDDMREGREGGASGSGNVDPSLTVEKRNAHFGRSPKISFTMKSEYLAQEVVIKFNSSKGNSDRDEMFDNVCRALGRLAWEKDKGAKFENGVDSFECLARHKEMIEKESKGRFGNSGGGNSTSTLKEEKKTFTTNSAGIAGIMRRQRKKQLEENSVTSTAFTGDLETLMDKANNVLKIIDRYSKTVSQQVRRNVSVSIAASTFQFNQRRTTTTTTTTTNNQQRREGAKTSRYKIC